MEKQTYAIYVAGELQSYQVRAFNIRDAILIIKGRLLELDYRSEITRVEVYNESLLCTEAYNNIEIKVKYEEVY